MSNGDQSGGRTQPPKNCAQCNARLYGGAAVPDSFMGWCSEACTDAWMAAHPEESAKWIKVEDLNAAQRAELDAILGGGRGVQS